MNDLTEQLKKGELTGNYWCEITESPYPEQVYLPSCDSDIIIKVLAPVPAFEEWKELNNACHELEKENACLIVDNVNLKEYALKVSNENEQLKELLERYKQVFGNKIIDEINRVLGGEKWTTDFILEEL